MAQEKKRNKAIKRLIIYPILEFIKDSRAVGILLVICTLISLILSNSLFGNSYLDFWHTNIEMSIPNLHTPHNLTAFINDALMAVFFLLVGMEIKRELFHGELSDLRQATLPVFAALGGMLVPAGLYLLFNHGTPLAHGWGIPMATDIAFSLGILSLLGSRVPPALKILLTALAIIDDLGAIIAIAIFYTSQIHWIYLGLSGVLFLILIVLNLLKVKKMGIYIILGLALWYCLFNSGVHATLSGVLLAFSLPITKIVRWEKFLHIPVNFVILPLFALANTAIIFPHDIMSPLTDRASYGIIAGLFIGKPVGIFLISFIVVKLGLAHLPGGVKWKHILGIGLIAGIGFTMSIFITMLAFTGLDEQTNAKMAILVASLISGLMGFFWLKHLFKKDLV